MAFFNDKILPILKQHCLACHSHASGKMRGGLTLDSRSGWQAGGDTGPAIVPGQPEKGLAIAAVQYATPDLRMPPKAKLPDADIALLVEWVKRGAPDPRVLDTSKSTAAWAFQPIVRPAVPVVVDRGVPVAHPIDAFVLAKLKDKMLHMSPPSDRVALIRRLTFDLHGLPPTPAEVDAFVRDTDAKAYENLVDRLLASPRYGERMGRLWLDVVHYGESNGYGMDRPRMNAWPYRDYVIRSFNEDKSYARFVQEQLAADVLPGDAQASVAALGFIATGPFNQSALAEQVPGTLCHKIALNLDRDDMIGNVATTFLSVTLHCARCHEHKFDPLSMKDYYRMQSVFAGVIRGDREFDDPATSAQRRHWLDVKKQVAAGVDDKALAALKPELDALERSVVAAEAKWEALRGDIKAESGLPRATALPDGSWRWHGPAAEKDTYVFVGETLAMPVAAIRLEVLADDALPFRGPGRQPDNGNLHLTEFKVFAASAEEPDKQIPLKIRKAVADFNQDAWDVAKAIDGNPATAWGVHPKEGQSHQAVFVFDKPFVAKGAARLTIRIEQHHGGHHVIGRLRLSVSGVDPTAGPILSPDVLESIKQRDDNRSPEARRAIIAALASGSIDRKLASLPARKLVFAVGKDLPARRNYRPPTEPDPIHILRRGDVTKRLAPVVPGGLEAIAALPAVFDLPNPKDEGQRRAALARWITDAKNPLTWRSIVNRVWSWHFDRGLVDTPNDFGRMGSLPSHPELLDWLAADFRDSGGSIKGLHRLIVTSAAYRQASVANAAAAKVDGDNALLGRMNRRRLDAEQLRDALLAASGKLDLTVGGPSVMQFQYSDPNPEVSPRIDYDAFDPDSPASNRRAVYRFLFRNVNEPLLDAFDSANPSLSSPRRDSTITPLQALSLFNNKFVLRQCEHLAERLKREAKDVPDQVELAYMLLYARRPSAEELGLVRSFIDRHGLVHACRVLVNANEFLFIP
ncbi:MAG: PSD1 and planctomycete cytochrome C domain-containing protein [Planctomycetota bacterium]